MRIANSGVLMRCWPRSPWYQARTRTMGSPIDEREQRDLPDLLGPVEGLADVLEALQESPGSGDVDKSPLDDLAAAQPGPGALGFTLCRRVGHSAAPMASECSGLSAGARGKQVHSDLKADYACWFSTNSADGGSSSARSEALTDYSAECGPCALRTGRDRAGPSRSPAG